MASNWNIAKALSKEETSKLRLLVRVIEVSERRELSPNKSMWTLGIADNVAAAKLYVYDEELVKKLKPNATVYICSYMSKKTHLSTIQSTKVFRTSGTALIIPQELIDEAHNIVYPPPAPKVTIKEAKTSPLKKMVSVSAMIHKVHFMPFYSL